MMTISHVRFEERAPALGKPRWKALLQNVFCKFQRVTKECYNVLYPITLTLSLLCLSCVNINKNGTTKMHPSPNFNERKDPVSMIVLHYTVIPTCEESLARLSDPTNEAGRVSAHYLVDRDGALYRLVDESKRAWHAGVGSWAGMNATNEEADC